MSKNVDEAISRKEEKCIMSFIPNMITIANFVCGLLAIYAVFVHDIYLGAVLLLQVCCLTFRWYGRSET